MLTENSELIIKDGELISFAWENLNEDYSFKENEVLSNALSVAEKTEILVIIGYSFPIFNREIDRKIIEIMKIQKVYIQDKEPEKIKSIMINAFKAFQPIDDQHNLQVPFHLERNVDQFIIPFEL